MLIDQQKNQYVPIIPTKKSVTGFDNIAAEKEQFSTPVVLWDLKANHGVHNKKAHGLYYKPFWFFDKAAPIPGVSFLKKAKILYSKKSYAYKKFQSMLEIYNKKQIMNLFSSVKKNNVSKNWNAIMLMDSLFLNVFRKTGFAYNAQERKALFHSHAFTINGKYYTKNISVVKAADLFCVNLNGRKIRNRRAAMTLPSRLMLSVGFRSLCSIVPKTSAF